MRFLLEVGMDNEALTKDPVGELGRILRYWGGNLRHYPMTAGDGSEIYDSEYREVGRWRIEQGGGDEREGAAYDAGGNGTGSCRVLTLRDVEGEHGGVAVDGDSLA